jgi:hypothetical protein
MQKIAQSFASFVEQIVHKFRLDQGYPEEYSTKALNHLKDEIKKINDTLSNLKEVKYELERKGQNSSAKVVNDIMNEKGLNRQRMYELGTVLKAMITPPNTKKT